MNKGNPKTFAGRYYCYNLFIQDLRKNALFFINTPLHPSREEGIYGIFA